MNVLYTRRMGEATVCIVLPHIGLAGHLSLRCTRYFRQELFRMCIGRSRIQGSVKELPRGEKGEANPEGI